MRIPQSVQVVVMRDRDARREFLVLRRTAMRGGFWQPVTGRVEAGESFAQAARRELAEETGVETSESRLIDLHFTHAYSLNPEWLVNYPPGTTHNDEAAFAVMIAPDAEIRLDPGEHDACAWVTADEAQRRLSWHGNREAYRRAAAWRQNGRPRFLWKLPARTLELGSRTLIMGVVNVTPDSFSDGGVFYETSDAADLARALKAEGSDIVDIGGESTRPGATAVVSAEEERRRILPVLKRLASGGLSIPISVDTYKSEVAQAALDHGAQIVNDISGLRFEPELARVAARAGAGLVLMHSRGTPGALHGLPPVPDIVVEILDGLRRSVAVALDAGVAPERIVVDPGIGFGKTVADNVKVLANLEKFAELGFPLLVGPSRKSFLGALTGQSVPAARMFGTAASVVAAIDRGAHVVRVHDVAQMRECALVADAIASAGI
jgi:dihydropteroate synthase